MACCYAEYSQYRVQTMYIKFLCVALISSYFLRLLMASAFAYDGTYTTPIAQLTRSMAQLDRVSSLCKDVRSSNYETYSIHIREYIKRLYDGKTPYWVLSNVKSRVSDDNYCRWLVVESLIHYQMAYRDYMNIQKSGVMPPLLTYGMSQYGRGNGNIKTLGVARPQANY